MKYLTFTALVVLPGLACLSSCGCGGDSFPPVGDLPLPPPPVVESVGPVDQGTDVVLDTQILVGFSTPVAGVDDQTFLLVERGGPFVPGQVVFTAPGTEASFIPTGGLLPCTVYDVLVGAGIVDEFGQHLTAFASSFTTTGDCNPPPPVGPCVPPIEFGTAVTYAVLAGSTVTNTGTTLLGGDLGLHPGSSVTGAPSVTGVIHIADAEALQAKNDLITAYNAAVAAPSSATRIGDIGGEILTAGVYTSSAALSVEVADLILVGGPDDVFIFQMVSSLTIGSGRKILLQGVRPCNVIWQVGSSATLNTGAEFAGTILALTDINLRTGATAQGRMLARNGQVVLDTNTVIVP